MEIGGDEGDRTPDLCNAIAALSQLSYVPVMSMQNAEAKCGTIKLSKIADDVNFASFASLHEDQESLTQRRKGRKENKFTTDP